MFLDINRFHVLCIVIKAYMSLIATLQIFTIFSNYSPKWRCNDGPITSNCTVLKECKGNLTFPENQFYSMRQEMDWFCPPNDIYASWFSSIIFLGVLCGTISSGVLSDAFGRKKITILSFTITIVANLALGFAPLNPFILIGIRYFVGLGIGGATVAGITYTNEMVLPQQRFFLRAFFNWGTSRLVMTIICMIFPYWRTASLVFTLFLIPSIPLTFIVPESPIWLHSKDRLKDMIDSDKKVAKLAGIEYVPTVRNGVERSESLCEIIKTKALFKRLVFFWIMWFITSISGFATDLYSNTIAGDFYINQIIFCLFIINSKWIVIYLDAKYPIFNRRVLHQGSQLIVVSLFSVITIMKHLEYSGVLFLICNVLGSVFLELCWDMCYLCVQESMETSYRASATGSCSLFARIGGMIAPFLAHLTTIWPPFVYAVVVALGTFELILSCLFLEESKGADLDKVRLEDDELVGLKLGKVHPTNRECTMIKTNIE